MPTVIPTEPLTDAVIAKLADDSPGILTGDGDTPENIPRTAQGLPTEGYAIVYPLDDLDGDGALGDANQWAVRQYQVTVVGGTRGQAENMRDDVRQRLMGFVPTVAGYGCEPMQLYDPTGVSRDDDVTPPMFFSTDRFSVFISKGG